MGIIQTLLPATAAQVAQGAAGTAAARAEPGSAQNAAVQNAVVSGQATVVSLSGSNPKRVASHGESRSVDASFEKQEAKSAVDKKNDEAHKTTTGSFKATA